MAKINDTTTFPITAPALDDIVLGTDVSDTGNSADGETVNFKMEDILKLGGFRGVQLFTSSGTWTKPTGCNAVFVFITGGGEGGGEENAGEDGGTAIGYIDVSSISSATITVGAGGNGTSSSTGGNGGLSRWSDGTNTLTGQGGDAGGGYSGSDIGTKYSFFGDPYGNGGSGGSGGGSGDDGGGGVVYILQFS